MLRMFQKSDLDVDVPEGTADEKYLTLLASNLIQVSLCSLSQGTNWSNWIYYSWFQTLQTFKPDLVIYDAGVDVHKDDLLGK